MKKSLILFVLLSLSVVMRANGDPVAERSALTLARTPVAVHVPEVKLLDEQCRFTLRDGYTEVEVRYLLHNRSAKDFRQKVKEITIRITAVKPGKKYNDLCVSEIILLGD